MNSNQDMLVYAFGIVTFAAALIVAPTLHKDLYSYYKGKKVHERFVKENVPKLTLLTIVFAVISYSFGIIVGANKEDTLLFTLGTTVIVFMAAVKTLLISNESKK